MAVSLDNYTPPPTRLIGSAAADPVPPSPVDNRQLAALGEHLRQNYGVNLLQMPDGSFTAVHTGQKKAPAGLSGEQDVTPESIRPFTGAAGPLDPASETVPQTEAEGRSDRPTPPAGNHCHVTRAPSRIGPVETHA